MQCVDVVFATHVVVTCNPEFYRGPRKTGIWHGKKCGVLHFGCIQRLACRTISASAERPFIQPIIDLNSHLTHSTYCIALSPCSVLYTVHMYSNLHREIFANLSSCFMFHNKRTSGVEASPCTYVLPTDSCRSVYSRELSTIDRRLLPGDNTRYPAMCAV